MNVTISNNVQIYKSFEDPHCAGWILDTITKLTQLNFLALRKGYPDYHWIDDEDLANMGNEINNCIVELAEWFKKLIRAEAKASALSLSNRRCETMGDGGF